MNLLKIIKEALTKKPKTEVPEIPEIKYGEPVKVIKLKPVEAISVCIYYDKILAAPDQLESYVLMWKYLNEKYPEIENVEDGCAWKVFVIDNPIRVELVMLKESVRIKELNNLPISFDMKLKKK